ncbi:MAG: NADH-quinone oxidoreductase subunit NuoK [Candidatus Hydrothermales bacterium]
MEPKAVFFLSIFLFSLGLYGVLSRRNALGILISLELIFNSANLNFGLFSFAWGEPSGVLTILFGISITALEVVVGFSIIILLFRLRRTSNADEIEILKG